MGFYLILVFASCQTQKKIEVTPQQMAEYSSRMREADRLLETGHYINMKKALRIYETFSDFPAYPVKTNERILKTSLLLSLRCKELAILDDSQIKTSERIILKYPQLREYSSYLEAAKAIPSSSQGANMSDVTGETDLDRYFDWVVDNISSLSAEFKKKAPISFFNAYFYISLYEHFQNWLEEKEDFSRIKDAFEQSPMIQYKLATFPDPDEKSLESLVRQMPDFYECNYALGEIRLRSGKILSAEKYFLTAFSALPESTTILMDLTKVYFALEEFEKCLELNDAALQTAPHFRDALMGRMICLSFLNRHTEAIDTCTEILDLGNYYMGEAHYWKAWNLRALNRLDEAWINAETAKKYLIGHHELTFLAGTIAFDQKRIDLAESYFLKTLELNSGYCEASYYLGQIYSIQKKWLDSAIFFEKSAGCSLELENELHRKIDEIEQSTLSEERKKIHLERKKKQLVQIRLSKATSYYNGAAGYFNAEYFDKAMAMAEKAAKHPNFESQSRELMEKIKNKNHLQESFLNL